MHREGGTWPSRQQEPQEQGPQEVFARSDAEAVSSVCTAGPAHSFTNIFRLVFLGWACSRHLGIQT